jgi:hypothetical protein
MGLTNISLKPKNIRRKRFFFEKKKQKTFDFSGLVLSLTPRHGRA